MEKPETIEVWVTRDCEPWSQGEAMSAEELRGLADTLKMGMESGEYGLGTMEILVDAVLALTDPTPLDAEWLDARWDRVHKAVAWKIHGFPNLYVNGCGDRFEVQVGPIPVSTHATRGDVLRLLWAMGVEVPEPKGGV